MSRSSRAFHKRVADALDSATNTTRGVRRDESTTVLLIRHAHTLAIDRLLCGRLGIPLSAVGVSEAEELGRMLGASCRLAAIYTSPLEGARATADAIGRHQRAHVQISDGLIETIPGGEHPRLAQQRIVDTIAALARRHPGATIALVSHAEIMRSALLHYEPVSLVRYHKLELAPASVSALNVSPDGVHIQFVNRCAAALGP